MQNCDLRQFWQATVSGTAQTIQFGKIGSNGQKAAKQFPSEAEANADTEKRMKQKLRKGYYAV